MSELLAGGGSLSGLISTEPLFMEGRFSTVRGPAVTESLGVDGVLCTVGCRSARSRRNFKLVTKYDRAFHIWNGIPIEKSAAITDTAMHAGLNFAAAAVMIHTRRTL